jgi:ubiquinone/menaquinone biosynthesis C-methylase UbiE
METRRSDTVFASGIPEVYDRYMVPLVFEPYADDLARRVSALQPQRVLETAAGTGVVTRALCRALPQAEFTATDLNQAMLDRAMAVGTSVPVRWQQADALQLPFGDGAFDVLVCQFGTMFFPDKVQAFGEARRVLREGGVFLFSVWDRIEDNGFALAVTQALAQRYPDDPPAFLRRVPHGYADTAALARDLQSAGFSLPRIETLALPSRADSARVPAIAFCQGTPLRADIEAQGPDALAEATALCTDFVARRFGSAAVEAGMQAHVVTARR